jgi:hypothetical protein
MVWPYLRVAATDGLQISRLFHNFCSVPPLPPWAQRGLRTHLNTRTLPRKHTLLDTHTHKCSLTHTLYLSHMHQPARARTHAHGLSAETRCAWEAWASHRCCRTMTSDFFSPTTKSMFYSSLSYVALSFITFRVHFFNWSLLRWQNLSENRLLFTNKLNSNVKLLIRRMENSIIGLIVLYILFVR